MKVIKLNESDIKRIVKRVLNETHGVTDMKNKEMKAKLSGDTSLYITPDDGSDSINVKKGNFNITLSIKRSGQNTYTLNVLNNDATKYESKYDLDLTDFEEITDNLKDEEYYESEGHYSTPMDKYEMGEWEENYKSLYRNKFEYHLHPINSDNSVKLVLTIDERIKINLMVAFHPAQIKVNHVNIPDVYVK